MESVASPAAVGGSLDEVLPDAILEELNAPRRLIHHPKGMVENFTRPGQQVTVALLRDRLDAKLGRPVGDAEFNRALLALDKADHIALIAVGLRARYSPEQLRRSVPGLDQWETYTTIEVQPSFYQAFPKAGKRR